VAMNLLVVVVLCSLLGAIHPAIGREDGHRRNDTILTHQDKRQSAPHPFEPPQLPSPPSLCPFSYICPYDAPFCCPSVTGGPACYDHSIYSCPIGSYGPVLCGFQEGEPDLVCGYVCYNPSEYYCCSERLIPVGLYPLPPCVQPLHPSLPPPSTGSPPQDPSLCDCSFQCPTEAPYCCPSVTGGPACYESSIYSCPVGSRGPVLCGFQEGAPDLACGTVCYNPSEYYCCNNTLLATNLYSAGAPCPQPASPTLPPPSTGSCNATNDPPQCDCSFVCPSDAPYCCPSVTGGNACYDSSIYSCPVGSLGPVLCGFQEGAPDLVCGTVCYNPSEYYCCNNTLLATNLYPAGAPCRQPTQPTLPAPSTGSCTATGDPNVCDCSFQCPSNAPYCCPSVTGGNSCYKSSIYSCPVGSKGPVLCGFQEGAPDLACGTICYGPSEYYCCNDTLLARNLYPAGAPCTQPTQPTLPAPSTGSCATTNDPSPPPPPVYDCSNMECPLDAPYCCPSVSGGPACYNPLIYSCPIGSYGPVLCGFQEGAPDQVCGYVCYNPSEYYCCDDELLPVNQFPVEPCFKCYIPPPVIINPIIPAPFLPPNLPSPPPQRPIPTLPPPPPPIIPIIPIIPEGSPPNQS